MLHHITVDLAQFLIQWEERAAGTLFECFFTLVGSAPFLSKTETSFKVSSGLHLLKYAFEILI